MSANALHAEPHAPEPSEIQAQDARPVSLTPQLAPADSDAAWWIAQVTLRLRREICWCWYQRTGGRNAAVEPERAPEPGVTPPFTDAAQDGLDLTRYRDDKRRFFETDVTARYLSGEIRDAAPRPGVQGLWRRAAKEARLDEPAQFVLALALSARLDASLGPVFAACHNDANRAFATLALAQRLWDDPLAIVACADASHPLFRYGLLSRLDPGHAGHWQQGLDVPAPVARALLDPHAPLPAMLERVFAQEAKEVPAEAVPVGLAAPIRHMRVVPLIGPKGSDFARFAAALLRRAGGEEARRPLVRLADDFAPERDGLAPLATLCWLHGLDVVLPEHWFDAHEHKAEPWFAPVLSIPVRWFAPGSAPACCKAIPAFALAPPAFVEGLDFAHRVELFARGLGPRAAGLEPAITEAAKRFRCQETTIAAITASLRRLERPVTAQELFAACRTALTSELDHLAQPVKPRFGLDELVLPRAQATQLGETVRAMRALARVHYGWGTAQAWNEAGLSVLFCGPPGTGKTMAAEALASELGMPMYRVDLSQVVNKYIGETEKKLKRIFDAVETSDCLLLFDEADALFGKRTEVKDAHDRFANIEISYLLERMERFKGLAVLATNRRKDLDEAFTRRLRYIIEFPLPGAPERERIWRVVFPRAIDVTGIDFPYLARAFQLAGGHIRSIAFNACLQAAAAQPGDRIEPRIGMRDVLIAVKRELDKLNRPSGREVFAPYGELLGEVFA
jgi:ATPase family associated with various cellular activities (AAA)